MAFEEVNHCMVDLSNLGMIYKSPQKVHAWIHLLCFPRSMQFSGVPLE